MRGSARHRRTFFFNDPATPEIYPLSLHDALPICLHARAAKQGGEVKLCGVSGLPMQVLSLMRLDRVFGIYPDIDRARLSFSPLD